MNKSQEASVFKDSLKEQDLIDTTETLRGDVEASQKHKLNPINPKCLKDLVEWYTKMADQLKGAQSVATDSLLENTGKSTAALMDFNDEDKKPYVDCDQKVAFHTHCQKLLDMLNGWLVKFCHQVDDKRPFGWYDAAYLPLDFDLKDTKDVKEIQEED